MWLSEFCNILQCIYMAFTRFGYDAGRIEKQLQESTGSCRYILNTPGTGTSPDFMEDPFIRMENWGANLRTNFVDVQSDLRGLTRSIRRDTQTYTNHTAPSESKQYPTKPSYTEQSRATNPPWIMKGLENTRWDIPPENLQNRVDIPFVNNTSTRNEQKNM